MPQKTFISSKSPLTTFLSNKVPLTSFISNKPPLRWPLYCPQGSGTLRQQLLMMYCMVQDSALPYLIFVNFGTPPHYLGLYKVHQKVRKFVTK